MRDASGVEWAGAERTGMRHKLVSVASARFGDGGAKKSEKPEMTAVFRSPVLGPRRA